MAVDIVLREIEINDSGELAGDFDIWSKKDCKSPLRACL